MKKYTEQWTANLDKFLSDYLDQGYATFEFDLVEDSGPKIAIRTISLQDQMEVEANMKNISDDELGIYRLHSYQLMYLSKVVLSIGNHKFNNSDDCGVYLTQKGPALLDKILKVQHAFERFFKEKIDPEAIENFTQTPSIATEQS